MNDFKCIQVLLNVKRLVSGDIFDNLSNVILNFWLVYGGLIVQEINNDLFWLSRCCFLSHVHNGMIR